MLIRALSWLSSSSRTSGENKVPPAMLRVGAGRVALLAVGCSVVLALGAGNALAGQLPVPLGGSGSFAALAGSTVTSTGHSTLKGDLGVWPGTSLTGFPPGIVTGGVHAGDPFAMHAQSDLTAAYNDAAGRQPPQALPADLGGRTLAPGVYKTGATPALGVTGTLTLDGRGDSGAVFVFQVGSALTTAVNSHVNLIGGAKAANVFWQIGSSATLGTSSTFAGSILALSSISIDSGVTLNGRALARNGAVTLINDTINVPSSSPTPGPSPTPSPTPTPTPTPRPSPPPPVGGTTGFCVPSQAPISSDRRPPERPLLLSPRAKARVRPGLVRFSWRAAARAARYTLMVDQRRMSTGCATRATMRVGAGLHSYRVLADNRYGTRSSRARAFAATAAPSPEQIRRSLGIDVLGKDVVGAAERITSQAAEDVAFRGVLKAVGKFATKASIVALIAGFLLDNGDLACELSPNLYKGSKLTFALTANTLNLVARAGVGTNRPLYTKITEAQTALNKLKTFLLLPMNANVVSECQGADRTALATIKTLYPVVAAAGKRLDALSAKAAQEKKAQQKKKAVCREAIKALTGYNKTFEKVKHRPLARKTKEKLDAKLRDGTITSKDLPGGLKFPGGPLEGKSLNEIRKLCK